MITQSQTIDGRIYERRLEKQGKDNSAFRASNKPNTSKPKQYPKNYYGPMPMDLDAAQRKRSYPNKGKFQKRGKLTQKERDERIKNKLCLYCGKPGHVAKECRAKAQLNNAEPREERQKAKRSSPPNQILMTAAPVKGGYTCEEESQKPRKVPREPDYCLDEGKAQITAVTSTHLHITTRYWRQAVCLDPKCDQPATHYHFVYDSETEMKHNPMRLRLRFCKDPTCPAKTGDEEGEEHMHQWSDPKRIDCRTITFDIPCESDEDVDKFQLLTINQVPESGEEDWENVDDIDAVITQAVRLNDEAVRLVKAQCEERGVPTPHINETIREGYLQGEYACTRQDTCMLRRIPHYHICHYDPYQRHRGMSREEANRASRQ